MKPICVGWEIDASTRTSYLVTDNGTRVKGVRCHSWGGSDADSDAAKKAVEVAVLEDGWNLPWRKDLP